MSKKIDLSKLLTKGSAKQRAALLIYHYTILESIELGNTELKPILTDAEAQAIFDSFKDAREAKIYNDYRKLNKDFIIAMRGLYIAGLKFEKTYYKYLYEQELLKKLEDKKQKDRLYTMSESLLIEDYLYLLNTYTAIKIYAKESGYTNKKVLGDMDRYFNAMQESHQRYPIELESGDTLSQKLSEIEPELEDVRSILLSEFNYDYEHEEE